MKKILSLLLIAFLLFGCTGKDKKGSSLESFDVTIGLSREPQALLPIKRNADIERQVNQYIFIQAADFDPVTLENTPVLLESLPVEIRIDTGVFKDTYRYDLRFREEARWEDGSPVTAHDYLFTIKMILNPSVEVHPALRALYKKIRGIEIDENDQLSLSVYTTTDYMLSSELVTNMEIFPEYFYDSLKAMRSLDLDELLIGNTSKTLLDSINEVSGFAEKINSTHFMRDNVSGAGPYRLESWTANNYLVLRKKENWWGDKVKDIAYLANNPERIIFKIIPDQSTAMTELKSGNIDVLAGELGMDFSNMQNDPSHTEGFHFLSPLSTKYYVLLINNRNEILSDKSVRKAIARLVDVDLMVKNFGTGGEKKAVSPIHPAKDYYDNSLEDIEFDPIEAKKILEQAGWKDSNGNATLDKVINGKRRELNLSITITGKQFGKSLALQLQENARKAGIDIKIVTRNNETFRQDLNDLNFDLSPIVGSNDLVDIDPFPEWHSSNTYPGGSNKSGFANERADSLIEELRTDHDRNRRKELYLDFQRIVYEEQPVIFLYTPTNNIIVNRRLNADASVKRPGYFANTFSLDENR